MALCLTVGCSKYPADVRRSLKDAGDNRPALERVLNHFDGDEEKYRAACFLIGNMGGSMSLEGPALDEYYRQLSAYYDRRNVDMWSLYEFEDSLFEKLDFLDLKRVPDVQNISADYLIKRIDDAFSVRNSNWARNLSFEEFCEFILPYRVGNEILEDWFSDYRATYDVILDSLYLDPATSLSEFCQKVTEIYPEPHRNYTNYPPGKPSASPSSLKRIAGGTCEDYLGLFTYLGRSYGVPVATDYTPQWTNHSKSHSWCAIVNDGKTYHYSVGEPLFLANEKPFTFKLSKVYRLMNSVQKESLGARYASSDLPPTLRSPRIKDVSSEYMPVVDVRISDLFSDGRSKCVFLCCFDDRNWVAVDGAARRGSAVQISDMGYPAVYLPAYFSSGKLVPAQYPLLIDSLGQSHILKPDASSTRSVCLTRKFMEVRARQFAKLMQGGRFELSESRDFKDAYVYELPDTVGFNYQTIPIASGREYRYVRYIPKSGTTGDISELEVYSREAPIEKLPASVIGNYICNDTQHPMSNIADDDALTYSTCLKSQSDAWVGLDLGRSVSVDKICFLPRSDDNFIRDGEEYELCYWDGRWVSLGYQTGDRWRQELIFDNVPQNALLLLHNLTRGKEERIFTYENGRQIWW